MPTYPSSFKVGDPLQGDQYEYKEDDEDQDGVQQVSLQSHKKTRMMVNKKAT